MRKPLNFHETTFIGSLPLITRMINPNTSSTQSVSSQASGTANPTGAAALNTFKSILTELNTRPMKPLALQRFAGQAAPRSLALQIHSDTAAVV
jgi:hypothetical protein